MKLVVLMAALLSAINTIAQPPEEKLAQLGITLPELSAPIASYVNVVRTGNLLFLSGKGPQKQNGEYIKGKLGSDLSVEQGYEAAKLTAVNQLAVLKHELKDLGRIKRIVKVTGFVNSAPGFENHPQVINGFSDLLIAVLGEKGRHARTALGVAALSLNMAVEVEMIVEVE